MKNPITHVNYKKHLKEIILYIFNYDLINASGKNGTLYIGMTNNLIRRNVEHKKGLVNSFTKMYKVDKLVYYEVTTYVNNAIAREKQLKGWNRKKKIDLIESTNPEWNDLFYEIGGDDEILNQDFQIGY